MKRQKNLLKRILIGIACGFINGFFGGGGGMIVVPMLVGLLKFSQKRAHATSIAIILPITLLSAIIYLVGSKFDYSIIGFCSLGVFIGGVFGALLLKRASNKVLGCIFSALMVFAGIRMLMA